MSKQQKYYHQRKLTEATSFEEILKLFPEGKRNFINSLSELPERLDFHPEGNTFAHIKIVTERLFDVGDTDLIIAAIYHDLGKMETFSLGKPNEANPTGTPQAKGHELVSMQMFEEDIKDKTFPFTNLSQDSVYRIKFIIRNHMKIKTFWKSKPAKRNELVSSMFFDDLVVFAMADSMTIPWTWSRKNPELSYFMKKIEFFQKYNK